MADNPTFRTRRPVRSLSRKTCHGLVALFAASAFCGVVVTQALLAKPAAAEEPVAKGDKSGKNKKKLHAVKRWYKANMQLGQHYMLTGNYNKALDHFTAVINYTPQLPAAAEGKKPNKGERRKGRRGHAGKLHKLKIHAYMGASVAAWRLGDKKAFKEMSNAGLQYADSHNIDKASEMFERLIAEPAAMADQVAPSVTKLEKEIETVEGQLP